MTTKDTKSCTRHKVKKYNLSKVSISDMERAIADGAFDLKEVGGVIYETNKTSKKMGSGS